MGFDDAAANGEAEAGAAFFCRGERLEDFFERLRRNTWSVIDDVDQDTRQLPRVGPAGVGESLANGDSQVSLRLQSIEGVQQQIQDDLFDLRWVGIEFA